MPLENNIKVESHVSIKDKIKVNIVQVDPYEWDTLNAHDDGDGTIWQKAPYDTDRAVSLGTADVSEFAEVDTSELDIDVAGTYPVYTRFKGLEATYNIEVKQVEITKIEVKGMTLDFFESDELVFDGECWVTYNNKRNPIKVDPTSVDFSEVQNGLCHVSVTYRDDFYGISATANYNIAVHLDPDDDTAVQNFKEVEGFDEWTSTYQYHYIENGLVKYKLWASRQNNVIKDEPVNKDYDCEIWTTEVGRYIDAVSISFDQWDSKQKSVSVLYSEDDGITWEPTDISSSNFVLQGLLPAGTHATKVKLSFGNASNQIGFRFGAVYTHLEDEPYHKLTIQGPSSVNVGETITLRAHDVAGDAITWSTYEGIVSLDTYTEVDEEGKTIYCCDVTGLEAGNECINAECEAGAYDEKDILVIGGGGGTTYTEDITFSDLYDADTSVNGTEIDIGSNEYAFIKFNKSEGSSDPKYYKNGSAVRTYAKNTIIMYLADGTDGSISNIKFTNPVSSSTDYTADVGSITWNRAAGTNEWINDSGENITEVTFTAGDSGQARFSKVEITYIINE